MECPRCGVKAVKHKGGRYRCPICEHVWSKGPPTSSICPVCSGTVSDDRCERCRGYKCVVCGEPVYRDESIRHDAFGRRHARCKGRPVPRPAHMATV